ncbi:TRAP-type C4-dicarboxylate transport system permease small subunit [Rhodoligotrophos appendicifer]|uniref:TRAP transporter small permease subunit n=1 Tax=Rhodoligotrophos appendicifer TaxID=987056 RepID=UPI00117D343C|nr:TRAP transporter small permease [Rhodoligotrophos appendicifer]
MVDPERPPSPVVRVLERLGDWGGHLATLITWLLAFTVTYDVILRGLGIPTLWAAEVSIYLMIAMAFIGIGATQGVDGHFRVTFLRDLCPPRVRVVLDVFALTLSFAFAIGFTYGAWTLVSFSWMLNFKSSTILQVPMWLLQGMLVVGGVLLCLATLRDLLMVFMHGSAFRDTAGSGEVI